MRYDEAASAAERGAGTQPIAPRLRRILLAGPLLAIGCAPAVQETPVSLAATSATAAATPGVPRDYDGDGFVDGRDGCPAVPGVAPDGCPIPDRDGDGFLDPVDNCADDPGVEPDGCPIPDSDGDGLLDPEDKCPREVENRNGYEDADGCPEEIPADLVKMIGPIRGIYFDLDKDTLRPDSRAALDRTLRILQKYPNIRVELSGHTDSTGSVQYCKDLSARRPAAVKRYLVEHGIDPARLETRGAGPDEPLDTNKTARGRARNRRIEFTILVQ